MKLPFWNDLFLGAMLVSGRVNLLGSTVDFTPKSAALTSSLCSLYSCIARSGTAWWFFHLMIWMKEAIPLFSVDTC